MDDVTEALKRIDEAEGKASSDEPSTTDYLLNRAKKGAAGFMGIPGDIVDLVTSVIPPAVHAAAMPLSALWPLAAQLSGKRVPTEKVIAGSKQYQEIFGYDPSMKTQSAPLRYMGGVVEMAAAGGPMGFARKMALPIALSTPGAGVGMEFGGDIAGGLGLSREVGEAVGAVAGGLPTAFASTAGGAVTGMLRNRFSPTANKARAEGAVALDIATNLETYPPARQNIDRSLAVSDEMKTAGAEFTPSLPARTGAPGLIASEKQLVSQNPGVLNRAIQNVENNELEIRKFVDARFPQAPEATAKRIAQLQRTASGKLDAMRKAVDDQLDEVAAVFEANPNNYDAGNKVRELVYKQKEVYRGTAGQKYQSVYDSAEKARIRENIDNVVEYTNAVLKADLNAYQQSEIPSVFRTVRDKYIKKTEGGPTVKETPRGKITFYGAAAQTPEPANVSFEELHSLYKRVNSDIASLRGSQAVDKDFRTSLLHNVKDMLETKLLKFEGPEFGDVASKLQEANRFYREEYLPRFKQGFGGDVLSRYNTGEHKIPNQAVVGQVIGRNNAQAAKDFKLLFDDIPEAWQSLRDGYIDALKRGGNVLQADGKINQKALNSFLRQNSQTLAEFPQIKTELQTLALDNSALLERAARITAQQKELAAADLYKLFQGKTPAEVIPQAMENANVMRLLSHHARGDVRQSQALARAIAEHVMEQADPATFLQSHREIIAAGLGQLGKDHLKNIETAVEAVTINRRSDLPTFVQSQSIAPDPIASKIGSSPRAIIAHVINVERGRTGVSQEAVAFLGRWMDKLRRDHKAVAMEAIFYDKDAARAIANLARNPTNQKARVEWVNQMAAIGIRAGVAGQGD